MPRIYQSVESTKVDEDGRVVSSTVNQVKNYGDEPSFIKLYMQDILFLADMPKSTEKILMALLKRASYTTPETGMQVSLSAGVKRQIMKELDIKDIRSVNNMLSKLVKGKVLNHIDTGLYGFNPYYFGKGDWQNISKQRDSFTATFEVEYDAIKGRTFKEVLSIKTKSNNTKQIDNQIAIAEDGTLYDETTGEIFSPTGTE